jgi:serine/threonine-protein kinase
VVHLIAPVAGALDVAHRRHLVHRDVKPQNILIEPASADDPERVFLTDFGLTKRTDESAGLTRTGMFVGTFRYAAPEQFQGHAVDGRTDQYSLGCVVYECLAGAPPYPGNSDAEMMFGHLWLPPPQPSLRRADLGPRVDRVLARALAKTPEERFPTCGEFLRELDAAVANPAPATTAVAPPPPAPAAPTRTMAAPPAPVAAPPPPTTAAASAAVWGAPPAGPVAGAPILPRRRRGLAAALVGAGAVVSAVSAAASSGSDRGLVALLFVLPPALLAVALYAAHRRGPRIACGVLALVDGGFGLVIGILATMNNTPEAAPLIPGGVLIVLGGIRALVRAPARPTPPPPPGGVPGRP